MLPPKARGPEGKGRRMKTQRAERPGKLKLFEIGALLFLAAFLASGAAALRTGQELSDRVVRLHVLANSDAEEDQALKLKVRDRILACTEPILEGAADRREAEALLRDRLPELERAAAQELRDNGCGYIVTVSLEDVMFPTREYEGFTLPAGKYLALRAVIGRGEGRNWWCVVFPPLCAAPAAETAKTALAAGLSPDQVGLITEENQGYVLKSRLVEFWRELEERWN